MPSFIDPLTVPVTQLLSHSFTYMCSLSLNHVVTQSLRYVCMHASIADPPAELSDKHAARRAEPW